MTDYTIPADTVAFDVSASSVGLLPFVSTTPWLWGDDEAILWGDDEEITFGFAYLRNWDTQSVAVTPLDISYSFDYALPAGASTQRDQRADSWRAFLPDDAGANDGWPLVGDPGSRVFQTPFRFVGL